MSRLVSFSVLVVITLIVGWWLWGRSGGVDLPQGSEVKHSVPLDEIVTGCPSVDCIPSIDNPKYESLSVARDWLREDDLGLQLVVDGVARF